MDRRIINPWTWQDQYGYVQANEATGRSRVLWCAGQTSVDAYYGAAEAVGQRLGEAGCRSAGSLLEVNRLAMPGLMIEIEATAAK